MTAGIFDNYAGNTFKRTGTRIGFRFCLLGVLMDPLTADRKIKHPFTEKR